MKQINVTQIAVPLSKIRPGPFQNRAHFNPAALLELAQSIQAEGVINPPLVRSENGHYPLLAGERRWRACCALAIATEPYIDLAQAIEFVAAPNAAAVINDYDDILSRITIAVRCTAASPQNQHQISIIENHQRENLNPIEEARDYASLRDQYGYTAPQIARIVGKSDPLIYSRLRLLDLDPSIQELVMAGKLPKSDPVIQALLSIPESAIRIRLAQKFAERNTAAKSIVASCKRTLALLQHTQQNSEPPLAVPIARSRLVQAVPSSPAHPPLCPDCIDRINALAEELCGQCYINGLTAECLHCPGVLEFITGLLKLTGAKQ
jgi:ParB family chromosome partitioning protein